MTVPEPFTDEDVEATLGDDDTRGVLTQDEQGPWPGTKAWHEDAVFAVRRILAIAVNSLEQRTGGKLIVVDDALIEKLTEAVEDPGSQTGRRYEWPHGYGYERPDEPLREWYRRAVLTALGFPDKETP